MRSNRTLWITILATALATASFTPTYAADGGIDEAVNQQSLLDRFSFDLSADFTTEYWFRGIGQENQGTIFQPAATVTMGLWQDDDSDWAVDAYVGTWNSVHDNYFDGDWFERDIFVGFTIKTPGGHSLDISYVNLYSPDSEITFADEIDIFLSINDSAWAEELGIPALSPKIGVVFETSGGSDAGTHEGVYLQLGIEPSFDLCEEIKLTLAIPVTFGFSIDDYYEDGIGDDDFFGYADVGFVLGLPLTFIPEGFGTWDGSLGLHLIFLGDSAQGISAAFGTGDDDFHTYVTLGISTSF